MITFLKIINSYKIKLKNKFFDSKAKVTKTVFINKLIVPLVKILAKIKIILISQRYRLKNLEN